MVFKNKDFRRLNIHTSIIFPLINSGTDCHAELKKDKSWFEKILTPWKKKKNLLYSRVWQESMWLIGKRNLFKWK